MLSVSAKKVKKNISCLCTFNLRSPDPNPNPPSNVMKMSNPPTLVLHTLFSSRYNSFLGFASRYLSKFKKHQMGKMDVYKWPAYWTLARESVLCSESYSPETYSPCVSHTVGQHYFTHSPKIFNTSVLKKP
jgi:hypothetical protein